MSEPAADPPVPPPTAPAAAEVKAESSSAAAETAAATGDDVKMEEVKPVEETWDDIPEHVVSVRSDPKTNWGLGGALRRRIELPRSCCPGLSKSWRLTEQGDVQEIRMQTRMIDNEVKMMRQENLRLAHERNQMLEKIQDNTTKIKQNKVLPYLVSKVVEVSCVDGRDRAAGRPGHAGWR